MNATSKRRRAIGVIDERKRYTSAALTRRGLGTEKQAAMRASGIVKPRDVGNYRWYLGSEVARWIDSLGE